MSKRRERKEQKEESRKAPHTSQESLQCVPVSDRHIQQFRWLCLKVIAPDTFNKCIETLQNTLLLINEK